MQRTLFTLEWLQDLAAHCRLQAELSKGEAHNALTRAGAVNRSGEIRDHSSEAQSNRGSSKLLMPDLMSQNVPWEVAPLPSVQGDGDALRQVLTQLAENALKFTRTRDPAVIRVWAED